MKIGFKHAFRGILSMFKSENNFRLHVVLFLVTLFFSFFFEIEKLEWLVILICSALVICLEMINSAIEKTCNKITLEKDIEIKWIKDAAAGAVLIAVIFSLVVAIIIFAPYFYIHLQL